MKYKTKLKIGKWFWGIMCIICMVFLAVGQSPLVIEEWKSATLTFSLVVGLLSGCAFLYYWIIEKEY